MGKTGQFDNPDFEAVMERIRELSRAQGIPSGVHVVTPDISSFEQRIAQGYRFIAYSIDAVFLNSNVSAPRTGKV